MRTVLPLLLLAACGPGFEIGDNDGGMADAGDRGLDARTTGDTSMSLTDAALRDTSVRDGGPGDSGEVAASVLAQVEDCAEIFETRGQYFDFETEIGALQILGAAEITGGSLRFWPDEDNPVSGGANWFYSEQDFRTLGTCIDARSQTPETARYMTFAGKAFGDGTSCILDIEAGLFSMRNTDDSAVITQANVPWAGEQLELRMFTYNEDTTSICEVMRLDTREVFRLESDDGFPSEAFHVEMFIHGDGEAAEVFVHEVSTGFPHARYRALNAGR